MSWKLCNEYWTNYLSLHFCISSECITWCQSKLKKPVKLPSMVSFFTCGTAGKCCPHSFLQLRINISPYHVMWIYWRTVWWLISASNCQIIMLTRYLATSCQYIFLTKFDIMIWQVDKNNWRISIEVWQVDIIIWQVDINNWQVKTEIL